MPKNSISINPEILIWAREKAHLSKGEVSKYVGTSEDRYGQFETGEVNPTIRQLFLISSKLNRPAQVFFLNKIPQEYDFFPEMRRLPGSIVGEESPQLVKQVNLAIEYREIALNLLRGLAIQPTDIELELNLNIDPEVAASEIRKKLGVSIEEQTSWRDGYEALRTWRSAIEQFGVLVFQMPKIELSEMRGLSMNIRPLPIIGINSTDYENPRIFTLFHEFTHILSGEMVLDSPDTSWFDIDKQFVAEHFCNQVAANILVPKADLFEQTNWLNKGSNSHWENQEIQILANRYSISRQVIIRRLANYRLISNESFQDLNEYYINNYKPREGSTGGSPYNNMMSRLGTFLPQLAFRSYYEEHITSSDLSSLFSLQVKNLSKMEDRVFSTAYERVVWVLYILDTSALVDAWNEWYDPQILPKLWFEDMIQLANDSILTIPDAVLLELEKKLDDLYRWCKSSEDVLCHDSDVNVQTIVSEISNNYPNLSHGTSPSSKNFADPFVIATAAYFGCAVVTHEKPTNNMNGPRIPDVCRAMNIKKMKFADFVKEQGLHYR